MHLTLLRAKLVGMEALRNRRAIVDRISLKESVEAVLDGDVPVSERPVAVLDVYRNALAAGVEEIRQRFERGQDGAGVILS